MRRGLLLTLLSAVLALLLAGSAMADTVELSETQGAKFPNKSFVLTLPAQRVLTANDVTVFEDSEQVPDVRVVPGNTNGARTFGAVLVIDTSQSMHGAPIAAAMEAARQFASHRPPGQRLGVVFFSHDYNVALSPTSDPAKIDGVLAQQPTLSKGTRLYDATAAAMRALNGAHVTVGSIVVLSDGADVGSTLQGSAVADAARRTHTRVFTVGLRSRSYNGSTLRELAAASGGRYAEASPQQLGALFSALGQRFGREYLVTYRSTAPLGSKVAVSAHVAGLRGAGATSYRTPPVPRPRLAPVHTSGFWSSTPALAIGALLAAVLFGLGAYMFTKRPTRSVQSRISSFVTEDFGLDMQTADDVELLSAVTTARTSQRLAKSRAWQRFTEDVDVARIDIDPRRLAAFTAAGTAFCVVLADAALGNGFLGVMALWVPFVIMLVVRAKADRERRKFEAQLPDNLQVVASAMRAGQSFTGALAVAVEDAAEPARRELNRTVTDERLGVPIDEALARTAARMKSEELEYVGLVARLQRDTGGNTAEVIDRVTETIRERADLKREVRTLTAQGRAAGAIVSGLPLFLVVVFGALQPGYFDPLIHESAGRLLIFIGSALLLMGWLTIRRLVAVKI
jgi:tight adherence protein B